jgi:hypothetical protein
MQNNARISPYVNESKKEPAPIDDVGSNKIDASLEKLSIINLPILNPTASVKQRITNLEASSDTQASINNLQYECLSNSRDDLRYVTAEFSQALIDLQTSYDAKLASIKKEYDHRLNFIISLNDCVDSISFFASFFT